MKLCLLDAGYINENNQSIIRLFCKDKDGKIVVCLDYNFEPYFYILPKKGKEKEVKKRVEAIKSIKIKRAEIIERILSGERKKFVKVFCFISTDVPKVRDIVKEWKNLVEEEYEYSINFYKRYLMDNQIEGMGWIDVEGEEIKRNYQADKIIKIKKIKPIESDEIPKLNLISFDIEAVEEGGKQKIVMLSMKSRNFEKVLTYQKDKHYGKYVEILKNEKELLEKFVKYVQKQDPDIILGFNSDMFDFQIIQQRADELKVDLILSRDLSKLKFARRARVSSARLKGKVHVDLFEFINNILSPQLQTEVLSLDAVSAELLGDKKIEIEYEEIIESWRKGKDLGKLAEYCLKDSELTLRLGEFILPQIYQIAKISGQLLFDAARMTYSQLVEWYLSKRAFAMKIIIPNQPKWDEIQKRREYSPYAGGFVKEPIGGLHEEIAVMDFRSLYPSILVTYNVSTETLNCKCCRKDGYKPPDFPYWFCKRKKGFISSVIKELIEKRAEIKKKMKSLKKDSKKFEQLDTEQWVYKLLANVSYGYFAFSGSKWYCLQCAESLASWGRMWIKRIIKRAEKIGFTVIYSDTDSVFLKFSKS
jgi:DNA polymerase I/DNA polymerase-2